MKIAVLGAGAWGCALAKLLSEGGHTVTLWAHRPDTLDQIRRTGRNERYLPGITLPADWLFEADASRAVIECEGVLFAVPSSAVRSLASSLPNFTGMIISATKGIEFETGLTISGVLRETMPEASIAALSGPSFAIEVARGIPTAIVAASLQTESSAAVQDLFHRPAFRVYRSDDLLGVELGGALKNVAAIAAGVCDGIGFGDNSKAALITRAISEMRRLGVACGAQPETFSGLSGLGDLTATCFSRHSRNRMLGERLAKGELPGNSTGACLAEGYPTARSAYQLARRLDVSTPIIDAVYAMLYEGKEIAEALKDLTERDSKAED